MIGITYGDKTQNQDQSIKPVSFKPINRIVKSPKKLMPLDVELELFAIVIDLCRPEKRRLFNDEFEKPI